MYPMYSLQIAHYLAMIHVYMQLRLHFALNKGRKRIADNLHKQLSQANEAV